MITFVEIRWDTRWDIMNAKESGVAFLLAVSLVLGLIRTPLSADGPGVNGDYFLKGNYIELGIHSRGYYGTRDAPPAGYHATYRSTLGFIADYDKDGWTVGTPPKTGDYFLPGSPEQGFTIRFNGVNYSNNGVGDYGIPATSMSETSSGIFKSVVWTGSVGGMTIRRTTSFELGALAFKTVVVMTNSAKSAMTGVYYLENVDPDQGADLGLGYSTENWVDKQPGYSKNVDQAWVYARLATNHKLLLGLGTSDSRARAFYGGFSNRDPVSICSANQAPNPASPHSADEAIALAYSFKDLAAGASVTFEFYYLLSSEVSFTDISVTAPVATTVAAGGSVDLTFTVTNLTAAPVSVELKPVIDLVGWSIALQSPKTPVTIPGSSSQAVVLRVTAPAGALVGTVAQATLNGVTGGGTASDFCNVAVSAPPTYTITATAGAGGSIAPAGAVSVITGADQTFQVSPDPGYRVADVLVDGSSVGAVTKYTFPAVKSTHTIGASFALDLTSPSVTTAAVSGLAATSATSGGNVTADGGAAVTARGVCWGAAANPTTAGSRTSDGTGTGAFVSAIAGLLPNTTYHVRAYATNTVGTAYGDDISFTTGTAMPTVTTASASAVTATSATSGGNVTADGGAAVTARGVCWGAAANPTTAGSRTSDGTGTGAFVSAIAGLLPNTTYHVRAYATNTVGTAYGGDVSFTTSTTMASVKTASLSDMTPTSATAGGDVTADGGAVVTARGVCWGTSADPTTADPHTSDGTGTGSFVSAITGLLADTGYHYRAYAANSAGTAYGENRTFRTKTRPVISGRVTQPGGEAVEGVTLLFSGRAGAAVTGEDGAYEKTLAYGWSGTVTPSKRGYSFAPLDRRYEDLRTAKANQDYKVTQNVPLVRILKPAPGAVVSGRVEIQALAEDPDGVAATEIHVDGVRRARTAGQACVFDWSTLAAAYGSHELKATAYDKYGLTASKTIRVTVDNPPTVSFAGPDAKSTVKKVTEIRIDARDDQSVARVEVSIDGRLKATLSSAPYLFAWDTASAPFGEHTVQAAAFDPLGQRAAATITVTVDNPPAVRILQPADGAAVSGVVTVRAEATDDERVAKVEFFVNGEKLEEAAPGGRPTVVAPRNRFDTSELSSAAAPTTGRENGAPRAGSSSARLLAFFADARGRLRALDVVTGGEVGLPGRGGTVATFRRFSDGTLAAALAEPRVLDDGRAHTLLRIDAEGPVLTGLDDSAPPIKTDPVLSPAVQMDHAGNLYYFIRGSDGLDILLKKPVDASASAPLCGTAIRVEAWLVLPDGKALVAGRGPSGDEVWMRIDPDGGVSRTRSASGTAEWIREFPGGLIRAGFRDLLPGGGPEVFALSADAAAPSFFEARVSVPGSFRSGAASRFDLRAHLADVAGRTEGFRHAALVSSGRWVFGILKHDDGRSAVVQYAPGIRTFLPALMERVETIALADATLLVSGSAGGRSLVVAVDAASGRETVVLDGGPAVERFDVLGPGEVLFAGIREDGVHTEVGVIDLVGLRPAVRTIAVLPGRVTDLVAVFSGTRAESGASSGRKGDSVAAGPAAGAAGNGAVPFVSSPGTAYEFTWDGLKAENGDYELVVKATDGGGQATSAVAAVSLRNVRIALEAVRAVAGAWTVQRPYGKISFKIIEPGTPAAVKYVVFRAVDGGTESALREIPASLVPAAGFALEDRYLEKTRKYAYRVEAVGPDGRTIGRSGIRTI